MKKKLKQLNKLLEAQKVRELSLNETKQLDKLYEECYR